MAGALQVYLQKNNLYSRMDITVNRIQLATIVGTAFILPLLVWLSHTGNPLLYFTNIAPIRQGFYVFSKLAALMSIMMFGLPALMGLFPSFVDNNSRVVIHKTMGCTVLFSILLHIGGFITATTLRSGHFTGHFLIPDIDDYYHARITVGLLAFILVLCAIFSKLWVSGVFSKFGHWLVLPAFYLSSWHALTIGTESRHPAIQIILGAMMIIIALGVVKKIVRPLLPLSSFRIS